jgi:hypothetical protein
MCNGSAALAFVLSVAPCVFISLCPRLIQSCVQSLSLSLLWRWSWRRRSSAACDGLVLWEQARRRAGVHVVPVRGEGGERVPAGRLWRPLFLDDTVQ